MHLLEIIINYIIMKISVIIVTKDRKEDLRVTLAGFLAQTYKNFEIIIVDNASKDGTREMIQSEYPQVKYLWLPDNFDIRSINIGVEMSDGDIIWRTDSDSHPETEHEFQKVVDVFTAHENIDIISMEEVQVRKGNLVWTWYPHPHDKENVPAEGYKSNAFIGTGAAIRRKVFDKIGGFWEFGFEELDFCTRSIVAGFSIRYYPNIRILHYSTPTERDSAERWIRISKQYIRYTWKYFPFWRALGRSNIIFFSQLLMSFFSRINPMAIFEGILAMTIMALQAIRSERQVVPKELLSDITLDTNLAKTQYLFFRLKIIHKLKRMFNK